MTPGHNGKPVTDRIADYIEHRAERFTDRAAATGNAELLTRATTLNAVASDIRAYTPDHPVAKWIADGDHWLTAWVGQMCTPWQTITKKTGIARERIDELNDDAEPTPDELELLAELWWVTPEGLRRSIEEAKANP